MTTGPDAAAFLAGRSRETRLRRDRKGRWFDGDDPIDHPNLTRAFDRWIDVADDGRYCLKNATNWAYVEVEGAPISVRSLRIEDGTVVLSLSDGGEEQLDPATLREDEHGALYCDVRGGRLTARIDRHAQVQLAVAVDEDVEGPFLALGGSRYRPPVVDDPVRVKAHG